MREENSPAGRDTECCICFDEPLDLSQVDYVTFGDVKIPVSVERGITSGPRGILNLTESKEGS